MYDQRLRPPSVVMVYLPLKNIRGRAVLRITTSSRAPGRTP